MATASAVPFLAGFERIGRSIFVPSLNEAPPLLEL